MTLRHGVDTDWRRKCRSSSTSAARVGASMDRACHAARRRERLVSPSDWATAALAPDRNVPDVIASPLGFLLLPAISWQREDRVCERGQPTWRPPYSRPSPNNAEQRHSAGYRRRQACNLPNTSLSSTMCSTLIANAVSTMSVAMAAAAAVAPASSMCTTEMDASLLAAP